VNRANEEQIVQIRSRCQSFMLRDLLHKSANIFFAPMRRTERDEQGSFVVFYVWRNAYEDGLVLRIHQRGDDGDRMAVPDDALIPEQKII
jgi:hypothetical protein